MPRTQPQAGRMPLRPPQRVIEEEPEDDQGISMGKTKGAREARLTRFGTPDRRFKGQRDLPEAEMSNPNYTQPRQGGVIDDIHVTLDGKPDKRFKENRSLTDDEVVERQVEILQSRTKH